MCYSGSYDSSADVSGLPSLPESGGASASLCQSSYKKGVEQFCGPYFEKIALFKNGHNDVGEKGDTCLINL